MQEKSIIITPNNRLARHLQRQFCIKTSSNKKLASWYSSKILPLSSWLENCWKACHDPRALINKQQEKLLWHKIINETLNDKFGGPLSLAMLAATSHDLIVNWQIKEKPQEHYETEDSSTFNNIYKKFREYCKNNQLVTTCELPTLIAPYVSNYKLTTITFVGFDEYNPQLQILIDAIKNTGCLVTKVDPNNYDNSDQKLIGLNTLNQEIITCATWAAKTIQKDPDSTIGIVVPNLAILRPKIHQIFTEIFHDNRNFNISAGIPLHTIPIIKTALDLVAINKTFEFLSCHSNDGEKLQIA